MILVAIGFLIWTIWSINTTQQEADNATTNANALADQVSQACNEGAVKIDGRDICTKAQQVKDDVKPAEPGPQGRRGLQGPRGVPGPAGTPGTDGETGEQGEAGQPGAEGQPGQDGESGSPGEDGEPGAAGQAGAPGKNGTTGQPGAKGEKGDPGKTGDKGEKGDKGEAGRGVKSVTCTASGDWSFTFTDGTTVTVTGPCRVSDPTPTSTPTSTPTTAP